MYQNFYRLKVDIRKLLLNMRLKAFIGFLFKNLPLLEFH
jgi:hypothetical protein